MKKILLLFCLAIAAGCTEAQTNYYTPPPTIPPYHILTTDSVYVTPANLKKNKPVMIIYFVPDCSHCRHLIGEMKPVMKDFKGIQIVMVTFVEKLRAIKDFYKDFDLKKYPNFTVGTEGYTYVVQRYYQVATTPYIAIYDKNHRLSQAYTKPPKIEELVAAVRKAE